VQFSVSRRGHADLLGQGTVMDRLTLQDFVVTNAEALPADVYLGRIEFLDNPLEDTTE
jgi:hypothetical protein